MKKSFYEAPEAELLHVKFERNFCGTTGDPNGGIPNINPEDVDDDSNLWGNGNS